jgi:hypothetical protein
MYIVADEVFLWFREFGCAMSGFLWQVNFS